LSIQSRTSFEADLLKITEKMVLGTAQFGMDYGIANVSGKPTKKMIFGILNLAWEKGVRRFDTAPGYGSEALLGEFILANGIQDEAIVLTKIPSLDGASGYQRSIRTSLEASLNNLGCAVEVLFFHNPTDSGLLLSDPQFFEALLHDHPVSTLGVSVYEPHEVENLSSCLFKLAFQFPFNVLDVRFKNMKMQKGKRYARSVFLQGLLASSNGLRLNAPSELLSLQKWYHDRLAKHNLEPVSFAIDFTVNNDSVDYFLLGVDSAKQLEDILNSDSFNQNEKAIFEVLSVNTDEHWLDPRKW